jgi:hypothetical protein
LSTLVTTATTAIAAAATATTMWGIGCSLIVAMLVTWML